MATRNIEAGLTSSSPYQHRGTRAVQRMVEFAPSTGGLALWVPHRDVGAGERDEAGAPPISTDGNTIHYGPAFTQLPLALQTGLVAHEVLHVALRHPQRYLELARQLGDVDLRLFNVCADAIVNSALGHLGWLELPPGSVRLEALLASVLGEERDAGSALLEWDVERLYRAVDDRQAPPASRGPGGGSDRAQAGGRGEGARGGPAGRQGAAGQQESASDAEARSRGARPDGPKAGRARALGQAMLPDLRPGPDTLGAPEGEAEQTREWSERLLRGHAGDGAFSMLRALLADLPHVRTPWEQVLRTLLCRSLSPTPAPSWSRPSRSYIANQGRAGGGRRMPWEPGRSASRAVPRLAVIVDVSGSIDGALLERFSRELAAITRRLEAGMVLVVGDDTVRRVAVLPPGDDALAGIDFAGGGGTDFTPLLEEAARHAPDIAVVLTDLEGPARFRPRFPVVWAVPESRAAAAEPFGRKLVLR